MIKNSLFLLLFISGSTSLFAQDKSWFTPINFQKAIRAETRTEKGVAGSAYWQNQADYSIVVDYNPETRFLSGAETITWINNSPDTLDGLLIHLFANLYKNGNPRDIAIDPADISEGVRLISMIVNDKIVDLSDESKMLEEFFTFDWINLRSPILPHSENKVVINWEYTLNKGSHMRTGQVDEGSAFVAYFFPRIGVYDDLNGWNDYEYLGTTEFYNDFGNFDVRIRVPEKFVVWATGELQNPEQVLSNKYLLRYQDALASGDIVHIVDSTDLKYGDVTSPNPFNTFHFKANAVTDFAFALSDHYLWDAIQLKTGTGDDDHVLIHSAYNKKSNDFYKVIHIAKKSIEYMSENLPAIPFPFPEITVFNGLDEMEYPMMVNDNSLSLINETFSLTAHEIYHSYFPFATGCNERKYAWMDEGLTSYFEYRLLRDVIHMDTLSIYLMEDYLDELGFENDLPLFSSSESIRDGVYFILSYSKAAMFYSVLNNQMGEEAFGNMIRQFYSEWKGKHPTGTDFLNSISQVNNEDLQWLISPWFFEFGSVDLGILDARQNGDNLDIDIINKGHLPAQVNLKIIYTNDDEELIEVFKPEVWADGKTKVSTQIQMHGKPRSLELIFPLPMDAYPEDNRIEF